MHPRDSVRASCPVNIDVTTRPTPVTDASGYAGRNLVVSQWIQYGSQRMVDFTARTMLATTSHSVTRNCLTRRTEGPLQSTLPGLSIRVITDRPRNTPNAGTPRSSATGPRKGLDSGRADEKINSVHTRRSVRRLAVIFGRSSDENLLESRCQAHHSISDEANNGDRLGISTSRRPTMA
jgi:hypothetical protein